MSKKKYIELPDIRGQKIRKKYYIASAVKHPAKADIPMMIWILKNFVKDGDIVLDPMAGIGGTLVEGMRLFPNSLFIGVELEEKFIKWCNASIKKTERIAKEDWFMKVGKAICVQGDARELEKVLKEKVSKIVSSPPYAKVTSPFARGTKLSKGKGTKIGCHNIAEGYSKDKNNIGNLDYGKTDKIVTSPPWGGQVQHKTNYLGKQKKESGFEYSDNPENIGNLPHGKVDKVIASPPYSETIKKSKEGSDIIAQRDKWAKLMEERDKLLNRNWGKNRRTEGRLRAIEAMLSGYSRNPKNIGNLKHGSFNKIITSPPFGQAQSGGGIAKKGYTGNKHSPTDLVGKRSYMPENTGKDEKNISNLPYADKVITSPPYEETMGKKHHSPRADKLAREKSNPVTYTDRVDKVVTSPPYQKSISKSTSRMCREEMDRKLWHSDYGNNKQNIGNLKQQTYLEAMFLVYQQCYEVLKPDGLMILITKDFIRKGKRIPLAKDTIKLCKLAGFKHIHTYHREIKNPSFWRILQVQKYGEAYKIDCEDIIILKK